MVIFVDMMQVLKFGGSSVESATNMSCVLDIVGDASSKGKVVLVCSAIKGCTDELLALAQLAKEQQKLGGKMVVDGSFGEMMVAGVPASYGAEVSGQMGDLVDVSGCGGEMMKMESGFADKAAEEFANKVWALKKRHLNIIRRLFTGAERQDAEDECHALFAQMVAAPPDEMVTYGEVFSTRIIARKLACDGIMTKWIDSAILVIKDHKELTYSNIHTAVALHPEVTVFVAPGFIASTYEGKRTTLGRGGSDLSASIYAAALGADSLQIWSDVPGIMTANPKDVPAAETIPFISYRAALDMAANGAKVLYAPAVEPAMDANIEMNLRNTFEPSHPGTVVSGAKLGGWAGVSSAKIAAGAGSADPGSASVGAAEQVATKQGVAGCAGSAGARPGEQGEAQGAEAVSRICLVAESPQNPEASIERVEACLRKAGIKALNCKCSQGGLNVYVDVRPAVEKQALRAIHREFFELATPSVVNVYVAGFGAVGKEFVQMLAERAAGAPAIGSATKGSAPASGGPASGGPASGAQAGGKVIRLAGLSNSKYYIINNNGIDPANAAELLKGDFATQPKDTAEAEGISASAQVANTEGTNARVANTQGAKAMECEGDFAKAVMKQAPRHSIFVDLTNSQSLYKSFEGLLREGINIVTSNRRSLAVPYVEYSAIMSAAAENGCFVRYETTVGSALPLLDGISLSANSGEEIISIEAVVSCTLNRILSSYARYPGSFAQTVKKAQEEGLAEADIREDLVGKDALRKLLILAREAGVPLEEEDVEIEPVVPRELLDLPIDEFYAKTEAMEPDFDAAEKFAAKSQCRQRFIATLERDPARSLGYKAHIAVRNVPRTHPAFRILGTENAIIVRSAYHPYPLLIQGPGEGARVAAGSVLNETLK